MEIKKHLITNTSLVCGAYELEITDMFRKAFKNGIPLPKDHGRLIDVEEGHWIVHPKGIYAHLVCDKCLSTAPYDCRTHYCPNCGRHMV